MSKIPRNAKCPCGSDIKYKKCCGSPLKTAEDYSQQGRVTTNVANLYQRHISDEAIRVAQQGLGRPIISANLGDYTIVATGNKIHWSKQWKTFNDFLLDYIKKTLGSDWGNAELSKPAKDRHPIIQWYDLVCRQQASQAKRAGEIYTGWMTGAIYCYLGLAYNLYLLDHNVELQARLVARLKDIKQFQGAYYELIVANCLIRAGFELVLEDEADRSTKHCEFAARSKTTGKRYWIEAKMRSVPGILGKTEQDGSASSDPTSRLSKHLSEALKKPAPDERIVFIDLNTDPSEGLQEPSWINQASRRLKDRERNLQAGQEAYVFITNMSYHREQHSSSPSGEALAYGLGLPDFAKPGPVRLTHWYRQKQKHIDGYNIMESLKDYPRIPDTLDGRPASETFSNNQRIRVGETYFFDDVDNQDGVVGTVTSATVNEDEKKAYVAITTRDTGKGMILTAELSDAELTDYRLYGDAYFGEPRNRHAKCQDIFDFYEWLVNCYSETPYEKLIELAKDHPDIERLRLLDRDDMVLELCEGWAHAANSSR